MKQRNISELKGKSLTIFNIIRRKHCDEVHQHIDASLKSKEYKALVAKRDTYLKDVENCEMLISQYIENIWKGHTYKSSYSAEPVRVEHLDRLIPQIILDKLLDAQDLQAVGEKKRSDALYSELSKMYKIGDSNADNKTD